MAPSSLPVDPETSNLEADEARMRRSLERAGGPQPAVRAPGAAFDNFQPGRGPAARPRQRFVQDGEVPVTLVSRPRQGEPGPVSQSRLAASESALATERTARIKVERSLHAALANLQDLQTKQRHAELAHREALQNAHARLAEAEAQRAEAEARLAEAEARRAEQADRAVRLEADLAALRPAAHPGLAPRQEPATETPAKPKRGPGRPRKPSVARTPREPKPVKWWLGPIAKARTPKTV